jgi:D-serine deaminase-like pyridoxal phosphate-dependent protein
MTPPAVPGQRLDEIDTPALILDLDAFEANLRTLADAVRGSGSRMAGAVAAGAPRAPARRRSSRIAASSVLASRLR